MGSSTCRWRILKNEMRSAFVSGRSSGRHSRHTHTHESPWNDRPPVIKLKHETLTKIPQDSEARHDHSMIIGTVCFEVFHNLVAIEQTLTPPFRDADNSASPVPSFPPASRASSAHRSPR